MVLDGSAAPDSFEPPEELKQEMPYTDGDILRRVETSADRNRQDIADSRIPTLEFIKTTVFGLLWPDLILSHLDLASLKVIFRSWVMMWALTLLQICGQTEHFMGPSSFLANFAAGIEIDGGLSVSGALVYCTADVASVIFSFLVSVVTHAINWTIRGHPTEQQVIDDLISRGRCSVANATFEDCIVPAMHDGQYLNIRTTTVTIFGMLFSFTICGYLQCVSKYFKLAWLLNSLFTIIVFPFNNFMPVWEPWFYARNCVVPMCIAFTMRFAVSVFLYPFSSNHKIVSSLSTACDKLAGTCEHIRDLSARSQPSEDHFGHKFAFINTETQAVYSKFIVNDVDMEMVKYLEVWFSRFKGPDLKDLQGQIRFIMSALSSFNFFFEAMSNRYAEICTGIPTGPSAEKVRRQSDVLLDHHYLPKFLRKKLQKQWKDTSCFENSLRRRYIEDNAQNEGYDFYNLWNDTKVDTVQGLDWEFGVIISTYEPLLGAACSLLKECGTWLELSSHNISFSVWHIHERREVSKSNLERLIFELNEELKQVKQSVVARDQLFALHAYTCRHFARRVRHLASGCLVLHKTRPKPILVWPQRQENSKVPASTMEFSGDPYADLHTDAVTGFKPLKQVQARTPDSSPPRRFWHLVGLLIEKVYAIVYNGDFLFSVKRAALVTLCETPYFVRPICSTAFKHWYLWVAVLTGYTVARQAVDGVYGFFGKLVFNFFGCLVGMVGWYISAGSGRGNPFGYAAVTAFVWLYICFQRQYNKHFTPSTSIVYSCTVTLVLGNSWSAGHVSLDGVELGRGFHVAWVRFVTVTIGIAVAWIGTIFPYVFTAKRAVREIIGNCLENLGELQSMVSNFGYQRYKDSSTRIVAHQDEVTRAARAIITNLNAAETLRKRLIYEPPLSGIYPTHRYQLLIRYVREVTLVLSLIHAFLDDIQNTQHIPSVLILMGWTNPELCAKTLSVMYMSGRAINDGKALPSISLGNLTEAYTFDLLKSRLEKLQSSSDEDEEESVTAVALALQIYERLDVVLMLIKELVGEFYDVNMEVFDIERQEHEPLLPDGGSYP